MAVPKYSVGEVARIAKVTIRTLHHYDQIGLLAPSSRNRSGYRQYTRVDIERLQQIRFHRELGLALEEIRSILDAKDFDAERALREHREHLRQRLDETQALITTIDRMLANGKGEAEMTTEEMFDGFKPEKYEAEVGERWGGSPACKESMRRTKSYGPEQWREIKEEAETIVQEMAAARSAGAAPESDAAMALAERYRQHIDRWFYSCGPEMHAALGSMYVADPRFAEYFDRHSEGLSSYVDRAIRANAARS